MRSVRGRPWMILAIIFALYVVSLGRALDYELVWDDIPEIQNSPAFDRPLGEGLLLTQVERGAADLAGLETLQFTYDSYRPVTFATYWIDIALWGTSARALHATNIALGGIAIVLAFLVMRRWVGPEVAWLPTAVYALHPVQIEAVAYVSGRGDVLAALFALAATYAVLRGADTDNPRAIGGWAGVALLAFALSLLAKESYLALPLALASLLLARPERRRRWWIPATLLAVAVAYVPFRAAMISVREPVALRDALSGLPPLLVDALRTVLLPFDLSIERKLQTSTTVGWCVLVAIALMIVVAWRHERAKNGAAPQSLLVLSGLCWFAVLLATSSIVVARTGIVADRYLFLSILGLAVAITALTAARRALLVGWALWGAIVLAVAWTQVPVWRDQASLYRHSLAMEETSAGAHYRVAQIEMQLGRWEVAVPLLERAIALDPRQVGALNDLAVYWLRNGRPDEAERLLRRAVIANAARFRAWTNLGLAQLARGNRDAGCQSIARALAINPAHDTALRARAQSCLQ